jgi:hypothetical protein
MKLVLILTIGLTSQMAFAGEVLFQRMAKSGEELPSRSYQKTCAITATQLIKTTRLSAGIEVTETLSLGPNVKSEKLIKLVDGAEKGRVVPMGCASGDKPCTVDGDTVRFQAFKSQEDGTVKTILLSRLESGEERERNVSREAGDMIRMLELLCE